MQTEGGGWELIWTQIGGNLITDQHTTLISNRNLRAGQGQVEPLLPAKAYDYSTQKSAASKAYVIWQVPLRTMAERGQMKDHAGGRTKAEVHFAALLMPVTFFTPTI